MAAIQKLYPQSKWHRWEPLQRDSSRQGMKQAFGSYVDPIYKFDAAEVVVSLDGDFLSGIWFPGFVRYARDFMSRRKSPDKNMNRLYVAETTRPPLEPRRTTKLPRGPLTGKLPVHWLRKLAWPELPPSNSRPISKNLWMPQPPISWRIAGSVWLFREFSSRLELRRLPMP